MRNTTEIISSFERYPDADAAVVTLTGAGFQLRNLGIIGDVHRTEITLAEMSGTRDRIKLWSMRGALAGGAGSFVLGAVFTPASISDSVFLLGYVAALAVYVIEGAAIGSGLGLASAMARDFGARKLGFVTYDRTLRAERFLLVARGTTEQTDRAKSLIVIGSR